MRRSRAVIAGASNLDLPSPFVTPKATICGAFLRLFLQPSFVQSSTGSVEVRESGTAE